MASERDLVRAIQEIVKNYNNVNKPADIVYGTVTSASPLKVKIDQKLTLGEKQLVIPQHLTNHTGKIKIDWLTDDMLDQSKQPTTISHYHKVKGEHTVEYLNALKNGDKVIMLRFASGQQYLIIDKVVV